jgi:integrase/recombinase XerD
MKGIINKMKIFEGIENYLINSKATKSIKTYYWEEKTFRSFIIFCNKHEIKELEHLDKHVLLDYIGFEKNRNLQNTTINKKIKLVKRMIVYNDIDCNLLKVKTLRERKKTVNDLSEKEIVYLFQYLNGLDLKVINNYVYKVLYYLLFDTGVRIHEALNIKKSNIDYEHNIIHLEVAKFDKERIIDFSSKLKPMILKLSNMHLGNYLFWNLLKDRQLDYDSDVQWLYRKMKMESPLEFRHITAHRVRHTFASMSVKNGMNLISLKEILGHENLRTTNIYLHADRKSTKKDFDKYSPLMNNDLKI